MDRKWLLTVALALGVVSPVQAGLIPNGDFETGDFTGWSPQIGSGPLGSANASIEFLDGSQRAVLTVEIESGVGAVAGELFTTTDTASWGSGKIVQFDLSYSYTTNSIGANVFLAAPSASTLIFLNVTQTDATPLSGSSPTTTYSMPWDGNAFNLFPSILTEDADAASGVSLTVILDNVRIVPEPTTLLLTATALVGVPFFASRRRRR
jgi:hypothetical protein